ncbi:hypothetical protein V6N11_029312 [Hibiscus sabdariffa]
MAAFSKPSSVAGSAVRVVIPWQKPPVGWIKKQSGALASCALVEVIFSLRNRWSVQVKHIPRKRNLVADRIIAMCHGGSIDTLEFVVATDLVVLVNKKANDN